MPSLTLALDIGTSSVRSLLFDGQGRRIEGSEAQRSSELITTADGGVEIDPEALLTSSFACFDQTLVEAGQPVDAVGISCFWHSLMGVDAAGRPTTPVLMYSDTRSAPDVADLKAALNDDATHARTGCRLHASYWPSKLRWLRRTRPEVVARTTRWLAFSDFLLERTHGIEATGVAMASATGMMDQRAAAWDPIMIEATEVDPATLPPIMPLDPIVQSLRPDYAARWPRLATARWLPGVGDGACANIGTGAVSAERIALTIGTTGAIRVLIHPPDLAAFAFPPDLFAYRLDADALLLGAAISNGGKLMAWLSELTGAGLDGPAMDKAAALPPDSHGLTMLPFLTGERSPLWNDNVTGAIAGLTLHTDKADLLRAGLESVAYRFARLYASVGPAAACRHEIIANGAAILRSPLWKQIVADALGHPIRTLPEDAEASARGAALLALRGIGALATLADAADPAAGAPTIEPVPAHTAIYRAAAARQAKLENLLYPNGSIWSE